MFSLYVLGGFLAFVVGFVWYTRARLRPGIPAPRHHWYFGSYPEIIKNKHRFFDWHVEMSEKYKRTWHISIPGRVAFKLVSGDCIEHVLKNQDIYCKYLTAYDQQIWSELTGRTGLLTTQDEVWRHGRKIASHLFSTSVLNTHMETVFLKNGNILADKLEKMMGKDVDMQDMFFRFTMDSFCEIAFGISPNSLLQEEMGSLAESFHRIQERVVARRMEPEVVSRFKRFFKTKSERQMDADHKVFNDFIQPAIAERRALQKSGEANPLIDTQSFKGDFISLIADDAEKRQAPLSDLELRDQTVGLLLAGRDTTACVLTSMFQLLSQHPEVEAKVSKEISEKIGNDPPSHTNVKELIYVEAVFNEALRLFPAAPINYRKVRKTDVLPDGTVVPRGTEVQWSSWALGRNPELYHEPTLFRPERWLDGSKPCPQLHTFDNPAFGAGPRLCLGRPMSYLEARILLVILFQRFRFRLVPGQKLDAYTLTLTLVREHGQLMTVLPAPEISQ